MKLRLIPALLLSSAALIGPSGIFAQDTSNSSSSAPPSTSSSSPRAVSCEQVGLVSITVLGAANAFCAVANTCNSNYIGGCPGANAVDRAGVVALPRGSCCAALESTGDVGCVSMDLLKGDMQCIRYAGARESTVVIDPSTITPKPTTPIPTTPAPTTSATTTTTTTTPPPTTMTVAPVSPAPTTAPVPTTASPSTTTTPPPTTTRPSPTSTTGSSASGASSSSSGSTVGNIVTPVVDREPEVGDEPTIAPATPSRTQSSPSDLSSLDPITEAPSPSRLSNSAPVSNTDKENRENNNSANSYSTSSNENNNGNASNTRGESFASLFDGNAVPAFVVGSVATVAIIVGAFMLRRKSSSASCSVSSPATASTSVRTRKHGYSTDAPPLTLDGDDDLLYDDLKFKIQDNGAAYSPIHVRPGHAYIATATPSHDRPSYFL